MMMILSAKIALLCCLGLAMMLSFSQQQDTPTPLQVWPQPTSVKCTSELSFQQVLIGDWSKFQVNSEINNQQQRKQYIDAFRGRINELWDMHIKDYVFYDKLVPKNDTFCKQEKCMIAMDITVENFDPRVDSNNLPSLGMDESYDLRIDEISAVLNCNEIWGCIRGMETFAQMIDLTYFPQYNALIYSSTIKQLFKDMPNEKTGCSFPILVTDAPRYPWRGLMIDTSRHFVAKERILKTIQLMSSMKLNVLHIHLVDAQSFPLEVEAYPLLADKGAYSYMRYQKQSETSKSVNLVRETKTYSAQDLQDIVAFGAKFGVRVIPEIDLPGHAAAFGKGYPETIVQCPDELLDNENNIPLDISSPKNLEMIKTIFLELKKTFSDKFVHIGGDEVVNDCYLNDQRIINFLKSKGWPLDGTGVRNLIGMFENNLQDFLMSGQMNKTAVVWEEVILEYDFPIPKSTIIQVWRSKDGLEEAISKGFNVLLSAGYYLDQQSPGPEPETGRYSFADTWRDFYENDPEDSSREVKNPIPSPKRISERKFARKPNQMNKRVPLSKRVGRNGNGSILGGEAASWAESVDGANFEERIFPRALAVAERLWSPASVKDEKLAAKRMSKHRCYSLAKRGARGGPVLPMNYCPFTD